MPYIAFLTDGTSRLATKTEISYHKYITAFNDVPTLTVTPYLDKAKKYIRKQNIIRIVYR